MEVKEKAGSKNQDDLENRKRSIFKLIYEFLSSLIAGSLGIITFVICIFIVFRHGGGLAEVSFLELGFFMWVLYCFNAAKNLAQEQQRSVFLYTWRLFALSGWLLFWSSLACAAWFKCGSDFGFKENFFASSLFELSLLLVVGIGAGLGVLVNVEFDENEQEETSTVGSAT
jgi:hypothetical protein